VSDGRPRKRVPIGQLFLELGLITPEQLEAALERQRETGKRLAEIFRELGILNTQSVVRTLASHLNVRGVVLRHGLIDPELIKVVGVEECERSVLIPLFRVRDTLTVAMAEPQLLPTIDRLRKNTGLRVQAVLALEDNILEFVNKYAEGEVDPSELLDKAESDVRVVHEEVDDDSVTDLGRMVEGSPIINLVNFALLSAVRDGASDIHIEPSKNATIIRYRIDGVLRQLLSPAAGIHAAIISRVKVLGKMDIAEKRLPQEGRVRINAEGREIDLRISSIPTLLGEKLVVRLLDKENLKVRMEDLGFRAEALETFKRILGQAHGLVLVTGPTGSGKTTTLYSALDLLRSPERNLVTVEDPVEYQLDLINQIQVNDAIGMSFARALRSILRQDPDIIMIGEIRDEETARVAVQAALTGHGVLATLHTNDAPGAAARLLDMNVEPYLLASALNGAVAQRLARTNCKSCETKYYPSEHSLHDAGLEDKVGRPFRKGAGCTQCHDSGCRGRIGIYEVMEMTPELRRMVHRAAPTHEMRDFIRAKGALSLREEGVLLALDGKTSLEEVLRVTRMDDESEAAQPAQPAGPVKTSETPETPETPLERAA